MKTLFISDLHISAAHPEIQQRFLAFLSHQAMDAEALYILGDLFEAWLGDDLVLPEYQPSINALRNLSLAGVKLFIMHGNRDFLFGEDFANSIKGELIEDPCVIDLYGTPTLLMHGDTLCTDDLEYQKFRSMVRSSSWQEALLAKPPEQRLALARQYREASQSETKGKTALIMDVNQQAVEQTMQAAGVIQLIHGHTHRQNIHKFSLNGETATRIVLGDWFSQGSVLSCSESGYQLDNFI